MQTWLIPSKDFKQLNKIDGCNNLVNLSSLSKILCSIHKAEHSLPSTSLIMCYQAGYICSVCKTTIRASTAPLEPCASASLSGEPCWNPEVKGLIGEDLCINCQHDLPNQTYNNRHLNPLGEPHHNSYPAHLPRAYQPYTPMPVYNATHQTPLNATYQQSTYAAYPGQTSANSTPAQPFVSGPTESQKIQILGMILTGTGTICQPN